MTWSWLSKLGAEQRLGLSLIFRSFPVQIPLLQLFWSPHYFFSKYDLHLLTSPLLFFLSHTFECPPFVFPLSFSYPVSKAPGGTSSRELAFQGRRPKRHGFDPCIRKIPWREKWQSTPVFLARESHGQKSLVGYSLQGHKQSDMAEPHTHIVACDLPQTMFSY